MDSSPDNLEAALHLADPLLCARHLWPDTRFYGRQEEIILSVEENDETVVIAGHQLGKDFVSGYIALSYFLRHQPCRVLTTSVKDDHLRVLWGEIGHFLNTCRFPLRKEHGGPLVVNHREIKKLINNPSLHQLHTVPPQSRFRKVAPVVTCPTSYLLGLVSEKGEGLAGHHAAHTLLIIDESSGVDEMVYKRGSTWAKRILIIGNPYDCPETHFFRAAEKGGDIPAEQAPTKLGY